VVTSGIALILFHSRPLCISWFKLPALWFRFRSVMVMVLHCQIFDSLQHLGNISPRQQWIIEPLSFGSASRTWSDI
jgi:hypothetical protein